jgi:hypothetical protein
MSQHFGMIILIILTGRAAAKKLLLGFQLLMDLEAGLEAYLEIVSLLELTIVKNFWHGRKSIGCELDFIPHRKPILQVPNLEQEGTVLALSGSPDLNSNEMMKVDNKIWALGGSEKHDYSYDYQLLKEKAISKRNVS